MESLYEISQELREVYNKLENGEGIDIETGELNEEVVNALTVSQSNLKAKGVDIGYVIKSFDDEIDIYDKEIKRLAERKKALQNAQERLKSTLKKAMIEFNIVSIEGKTLKIGLRKSESVEVNLDELDDRFKRVKVEADKTAIKNAIKNGEEVKGAVLVENKSLQIR